MPRASPVADAQGFKQLFELLPDPAWIIDGDRFVECNEAALRALGHTAREAFLNMQPSALSPPTQPDGEASDVKAERMMTLARAQGLHRFEWTHRRADGSLLPVEVTLSAIELPGRQVLYCVWRDLTERLRTEGALRQKEAWLQALSTMSSDWFWRQDDQFRFTEFTGAFAVDFTPPANALGRTRWELGQIDLSPQEWAAHRAVLEAHAPIRGFEYPISDGNERRWYSINGEPQFDPAGRFVGYLGTGHNITAQKLAEQELRVAAAAFELQDAMMITDAQGVIVRVNRAFTAITGYDSDEAVGQSSALLNSGRHGPEFFEALWDSIRRTGGWRGEIWNKRKGGDEYPAWMTISAVHTEAGEISHYVGSHSDISERKRAEQAVQQLAFTDPLTELPNRRFLLDRLQQALAASDRSGNRGALLLIDLDNFKTLNDTLGHESGDQLLRQVAERLKTCLRAGDTVARLGGDEFVVMLEGLVSTPPGAAAQSESVGDKILTALNQPYLLAGYEHRSTPSIGVTLFGGSESSVEELLKQADLAMYQAKSAGRNTMRFFDPQMQAVVTARAALEADLREAIGLGQFELYYQPQVTDLGAITGAEALLRWHHPRRGLVPPLDFIPLAEDTGLILPIGRWVLETACGQLARWANDPARAHLRLAVNVSARQLHQADFVDQVKAALADSGADPRLLDLELTESLLVTDIDCTISKMQALKALGVGFSLDDFGTGYSSLAHLKRLPLDQLKIDRTFVRDILVDPNDAAIARMVIALGESMALTVIAEGVETEAQKALLIGQGCRAYQGYLFGRPLPLLEFERLA